MVCMRDLISTTQALAGTATICIMCSAGCRIFTMGLFLTTYYTLNPDPDVAFLEFAMENDSQLEPEPERKGRKAAEEKEEIGGVYKSQSMLGLIIETI